MMKITLAVSRRAVDEQLNKFPVPAKVVGFLGDIPEEESDRWIPLEIPDCMLCLEDDEHPE